MYELYVVMQNWLLVQHECLIHVYTCQLLSTNVYTCICHIHVKMYTYICVRVAADSLINRRACEGYSSRSVCLSVCLSTKKG